MPASIRSYSVKSSPLCSAALMGCFALCAAPIESAAQAPVIVQGTIVGAHDSSAIGGVVVKLDGMRDSARTSPSGAFELQVPSAGRYTLRANALGFAPLELGVVVPETGRSGRIALRRLQVMRPVAVEAHALRPAEFANTYKHDDFFRRRSLGQGTFRAREDILKLGAPDLASALQGIAGFNVSSTVDPTGQLEYRFRISRCPGQPPNLAIYRRLASHPLGETVSEQRVRAIGPIEAAEGRELMRRMRQDG